MKIAIIAEVTRNGVIGNGDKILWDLPEGRQFFRRVTMNHPVIMGRKTWESIPEKFRPLAGRTNIVVTRQKDWRADGAIAANTLEEALEHALEAVADDPHASRAYVIGGAQLYALAMPHADELVMTEIDRDYQGDARFPGWTRGDFIEVSRETHVAAPPNDFKFAFVTLRRVVPG